MTSALERAAVERGGRVEERRGRRVVARYADPAAEARALASGAGVVAFLSRGAVEATGADAPSFLHRLLSQDVATLVPGRARRAAFLTREGRVLVEPVVWRLEDRSLLVAERDALARALPTLSRYVVADDVTLADVSDRSAHLLLSGPVAPDALAAAGVPPPSPGAFVSADALAPGAFVLRRDLGDRPAFDVLVPADAAGLVLGRLAAASATPSGEDAFDVARVETGTPAYGAEVDERVLPTEAGLEEAVSFTKGCYLGQEVVTMARHRGHPPTLLVRLEVEGDAVPGREAPLVAGGKAVGRVTTAARGALHGGVLALGFVRHDLANPGTAVTIGVGGPAARVEAVLAR
jgi:folate-binding protein YgfZ